MSKRKSSSLLTTNLALAATIAAVFFTSRPVLFAPSNAPDSVTGRASVIDGDTLDIGGRRIRLYGIDAPESAQICRDERDRDYACGRQATGALAARVGQRTVACDPRDMDDYGRIVAVCRVGQEEVNEWLVRRGWAVADRKLSRAYVRAEADAKSERLGIWAGDFTAPEEWRRH
jgi:endonuclease YncB( thermonuclease family)